MMSKKGKSASKKEKSSSKNEESSKLRCRNVMYEQQIKYCPYKSLEELENAVKNMKPPPVKYALIIHDKDINGDTGELIEPHFHAFMRFENARSLNQIATDLGEESQQVNKWDGNTDNGFAYLCHRTEGAKDKYQYDPCDVVANFDYVGYINELDAEISNQITAEAIDLMLNDLYKGNISKSDVESRLTGKQYAKYKRNIDDISKKCLERQAEEWRLSMIEKHEHIQVIWIYGKAGVGKTRLAKHRAAQNGDYYMSGSSRDIFQNYAGQHTVILDELRPQSISYGDLLRILDPYGLDTNVMAPSRYNDKALAVGLFIITTPYNPLAFYHQIMPSLNVEADKGDSNPDSFEQLLRRITLTIMVDEKKIYQMKYNAADKGYVKLDEGRENTYFSNPEAALNITPESTNLFDSMFV